MYRDDEHGRPMGSVDMSAGKTKRLNMSRTVGSTEHGATRDDIVENHAALKKAKGISSVALQATKTRQAKRLDSSPYRQHRVHNQQIATQTEDGVRSFSVVHRFSSSRHNVYARCPQVSTSGLGHADMGNANRGCFFFGKKFF